MAMSDIGGKIDRYDIVGELGRGGMGVVYDAIDPRLDRRVAIKVIEIPADPNMTQANRAELIERFRREAEASAKLNHPNIVSVFDFGEQDGRYYMVMEFLQGRDLSQLLKIQCPLSLPVALKAIIQTCDALDFAHHRGIVHRDIKPANIVILDNGTSKLADFGIARLEAAQSNLTQAGTILGSLLYISPEQLMNAKEVDKRADIYSLGVTLYEVLTGQLPYNGTNIGEIVMKIMQSEPVRPSDLNSQLPPELDGIIFKAMAKTADMRYANAKEFQADLNQVLQKVAGQSATLQSIDLTEGTYGGMEVGLMTDNAPTLMSAGTVGVGSVTAASSPSAPASSEFNLVEGIDDASAFSSILRVVRNWNVENLTTNTMLEAIYQYEGKSQALIINNTVILLIYRGLIVGAVSKENDVHGAGAYQRMASWTKFEMTQCMPIPRDEPWMVLLAIMVGANTLLESHPMCSSTDANQLISLQKSKNFSGMIRIIDKKRLKWLGLLDGKQAFSISMPYLQGQHDAQFLDLQIFAPRFNLLGPSLRKLLVEAQLQAVSKSVNRPVLSHFIGAKEKQLTSEVLEEALRNTDLTAVMPKDATYEIGNRRIKYSDIIKETDHYKLIDWLMYAYMYDISRSTQFEKLKKRFSWIWQFKNLKFLQPIKLGSFSATFDILAYNNQEMLTALFRFEDQVDPDNLEKLIHDIKYIKQQKPGEIQAVVQVSRQPINNAAMAYFNNQTTKPGNVSFLNFSESAKGYVKMGWNQGFYLFLVYYNEGQVNLTAPYFDLGNA